MYFIKNVTVFSKRNIVTRQVMECDKDSKKLYALVNKLTYTVDNNPMPKMDDLSTLPDSQASQKSSQTFFLTKIEKIRENLAAVAVYQPNVRDVGSLDCFQEITESEVYKIIMSMKVKSCELDPLSGADTHHLSHCEYRSNMFPKE